MLQLLRTNPGLLIWVILFAGAGLVCLLVGTLMARAGASLRPVQWFAGFIILIGLPQFMALLYFAVTDLRGEQPRVAAMATLASETRPEARRESAKLLFGPDADADLVVDARKVLGAPLAKAQVAQFASFPTGESVLLARFKGYADAQQSWVHYLRDTGLNQLSGKGNSQSGYAVTRPTGDRAYVVHRSNWVGVWTGPDDSAIRNRMLAGGFKIPRRAPLAMDSRTVEDSDAKPLRVASVGGVSTSLIAGGLALYLLVVVAYFFKGAAWAGSSPAKAGAAPVSATELRSRLEAVNSLDVPFRLDRGEREDELVATWRYADAKWIDLARARGMHRMHRIKLKLDATAGIARATDAYANYDWSAGLGGAGIEWKSGLGIVFFHHEHQRVFGLQLDEQGRFQPELSYAYTFNLQEMKSPLIEAVTRAGWTWRPVVWQGPKWLRWLTE